VSYMFGMSDCYLCHMLFTYNVDRVPSVIVNGRREPLCADCVRDINPKRIARGLPPIVPLPGAYEPEDLS
jgi:hypothetical protein